MSWYTDVSTWTRRPLVIQAYNDQGESFDYLPERTCTNIADRYNDFECSECGARWGGFLRGVFHYCPECGAKVVE